MTVSGYEMTDAEFDAFRFFTLGLEREDLAGRDALIGNAWNESGPAIATWREPGGLVVRVVGIGEDLLDPVREFARRAEELDLDSWASIVNATVACFPSP